MAASGGGHVSWAADRRVGDGDLVDGQLERLLAGLDELSGGLPDLHGQRSSSSADSAAGTAATRRIGSSSNHTNSGGAPSINKTTINTNTNSVGSGGSDISGQFVRNFTSSGDSKTVMTSMSSGVNGSDGSDLKNNRSVRDNIFRKHRIL